MTRATIDSLDTTLAALENRALSMKRAEAVRSYLIANMAGDGQSRVPMVFCGVSASGALR